MNKFILDVVAATFMDKILLSIDFSYERCLISFINNISVYLSSTDRIIRRRQCNLQCKPQ